MHASLLSLATFHWIQPILSLGYQRPLQANDLWKLDKDRLVGPLSDQILSSFRRRQIKAKEWNAKVASGEVKPGFLKRKILYPMRNSVGAGSRDGKKEAGLGGALYDVMGRKYMSAGYFKIIADALSVTTPLVTKTLIQFGTQAYYSRRGVPGFNDPNIGRGIGAAFGLLLMSLVSSLCLHQVSFALPLRSCVFY